ncbi:MAG: ParB/RepB/Spo0J family partition protein [Chitinispirillales bacterium]|jgi:ParB/RepB/Spo0J family partition protein|nr:ParB/RepB/Spo0J family partition protein [Chitinispirillales bacterium]
MGVKKGTTPKSASVENFSPELVKAVKAAAKAKAAEPTIAFARTFNPGVALEMIVTAANIRLKEITPDTDPKLLELVESIKQQGIQAPLLLLNDADADYFSIIAGHRRFAAAKLAGLEDAPAYIYVGLTPRQILEIQISENIHRADLAPSEEAAVYERMRVDLDYTIEEVALRVGKSAKHISRYLKLLMLPEKILTRIDNGEMSLAKAQILCSLPKATIERVIDRHDYLLKGGNTAKEFEHEIRRLYMADLGSKNFDLKKQYRGDDGTIWPACTECPHKGQLEMFEEFVNDDKCPFADCFNGKTWVVEEQKRKAKKKKQVGHGDDDDDDDDGDYEETSEERAEREKREARYKEQEEKRKAERIARAADCKIKAEWYIEHKTQAGFRATDFFFTYGNGSHGDPLEHWYSELTDVLNELYVKYVGKNIDQLKEDCTYEEISKAAVIYTVYSRVDDGDDSELAEWIGCGEYPEKEESEEEEEDEGNE